MTRFQLKAILLSFLVAGCHSAKKVEAPRLQLKEAVESRYRSDKNRQRDVYRHPLETLEFFGLEPAMTVVEITPGGGWYTEILAPFLAAEGRYVAAIFPENTTAEYMKNLNARFMSWMSQYPEVGQRALVTRFNLEEPAPVAPEGSADVVLTFRNVHNWIASGQATVALELFYKALKPGGVLGVVTHRASGPSEPQKGYISEADVIELAQAAGFQLQARSEINANPKDTKNHPEGVWTLPPSLRLGDKDRDKYLAVGESDRMTLKFIKPAK